MDPASNAPLYLEKRLSRSKFEELISPLLNRVRGPVESALKDAKLSKSDIDEVILVGGLDPDSTGQKACARDDR